VFRYFVTVPSYFYYHLHAYLCTHTRVMELECMNEREQTCIDKREKTIRPHTDINNSRVSQQPGDYTVLHNSKLTSEISDSKNNVATSAT